MPRKDLPNEIVSDAGHSHLCGNYHDIGRKLSAGIKRMIAEGRMAPNNADEAQLRKDYIKKHGTKKVKKRAKGKRNN